MKSRFRVSPEVYKISHKHGNAYVLIAHDGTIKTVSLWRIIPLSNTLGNTLPQKFKVMNNNNLKQKGEWIRQ